MLLLELNSQRNVRLCKIQDGVAATCSIAQDMDNSPGRKLQDMMLYCTIIMIQIVSLLTVTGGGAETQKSNN